MPRRSCPVRPRPSSCPLAGERQRSGGVLRRRETAGAEQEERESGRERPHLSAAWPSRPRPGGRSRPRVGVVGRCTSNDGGVGSLLPGLQDRKELRSADEHEGEVRLLVEDMDGDFALDFAAVMDGGSG